MHREFEGRSGPSAASLSRRAALLGASVGPWLGSFVLHLAVFAGVRSGALDETSSETMTRARLSGETFELSEFSGDDAGTSGASSEALPSEGAASEPPLNGTARPRSDPGEALASEPGAATEPPQAPPRPEVSPRSATRESATGASREKSERSVSSPSGAGADESSAPATAQNAGTYGEAGVRAERGRFPDAFTRVLPAAAQGLRALYGAPEGRLAKALVRVTVADDGRLESLEVAGEKSAALEALLGSVRILLRSGRFALPPGSRGTFDIGLVVDVEMGEADEELLVDERDQRPAVRQLSSKYPTPREPGEALVRYGSGKRLVLRVFEAPNPRDF